MTQQNQPPNPQRPSDLDFSKLPEPCRKYIEELEKSTAHYNFHAERLQTQKNYYKMMGLLMLSGIETGEFRRPDAIVECEAIRSTAFNI